MALIPVAVETLAAGSPLPYPLFDSEGRQLFRRGAVIDSPALLERIISGGLYRQEENQPLPTGDSYALDAVGASIGDEVLLDLPATAEAAAAPLQGALIGFVVRQGVAVALESDAVPASFFAGQMIRARLSAGKNCYVFDAELLEYYAQPYPHLHLSYPSRVTALTQRSQARVTVNLAASVTSGNNALATSVATPVLIRNISPKGALLMAQTLLGKEGDAITLKFRLKIGGIDHIYVLAARLCRITSESGSQPPVHLHGIEFVDMDAHNIATRARRSWQTFISYLESKGKAQ